jgi:23S rRNA (uridine2552-2'-O)-methyltransferase
MIAPRSKGRLHVQLRGAKKRSLSSQLWLERQLNDPYVARAKREGLRARSAYKLTEIDDEQHFLRPGGRVVDLGAAPGSWSQVAAKRVQVAAGRGCVIAIDLLEMASIPGVEFLRLDFLDKDAAEAIKSALQGAADVVLSDMAPNASGHARTFAVEVLAPGGTFVCKVLQGGTEASLLAALKRDFMRVKHVKPAASRADSAELYLLATGFRGSQAR